MNFLRFLLLSIAAIVLNSNSGLTQIHSSTSAHTTYTGLSMTGYQGWFGTPNDGGTNGWRHYNGKNGFKPGSASIEYWPDMREADEDEKYETSFTFDNGSPAYVFSSVHPKSVNRHFQWMKEYGIDGAFMQRFRSDFGIRPTMNKILKNGLDAARKNDRAISLMYDIGANIKINGIPDDTKRTQEVNLIFNDWKQLIDELNLTTGGDDQPYLYHNGKPLIVLWGVGFNHRHGTTGLDMQYWVELVDSLQNSPEYGGCSIMLGVPTKWRNGGGDCVSGSEHQKMLELIKTIEIVQPWHTSRFSRDQMATEFKSLVEADVNWCKENGVGYTPTVSPGIREKILHGNGYEKYREGGYYFWDMAKAAIEAGSEMLYLGMFDEVDEGTQYHKINNNPPFYSNVLNFADYGSDPEDHYLWLAGEATRALRGEFTMESTYRKRAVNSDFQSQIIFTDNDSTYTIELTKAVTGRTVFYADPYKVPDGSPTIGTVRDANLFKNELSTDPVTFGADQRGLFIRLVEVDSGTDKIISFDATVATRSYTSIPFATGFEDGKVNEKYWALSTESSSGRTEVTNKHKPNTGDYHLAFDVKETGTSSVNHADLHINLKGILSDVILDISYKSFGEQINPEDGIYFSDDAGATFKKVHEFEVIPNTYIDTTLIINDLVANAGLNFSDKFIIRLQHKDNDSIDNAGIVFDDIRILNSEQKSGFAQFVKSDNETQGAWIGNYGVDGQYIVGKESNLPDYANLTWGPNIETVIWENNSTDIRGLKYTADSTILSANYADTVNHPWWFSVDIGEVEKEVSMYFLDGDNKNRKFILNVVDNATGDKYDIQTIQNYEDGKWLTWKIKGKVKFIFESLDGFEGTVSGIFFNPSSPSEIEVETFLTFDGDNDFVDAGKDESLRIQGNEITLEAWFNITEAKTAIYQSTILAMDHSESGNDVGYFLRANGNGQIEWGFGDGKWHQVKSKDGVQLFEIGTWNHIAGVYDGTFQSIFLNGNLIATGDSLTTNIKATPTENLYIGSTPSFSDRVINGGVAEVRVWNIARTASEIKEFATKRISGTENGLAGYWPINEGEGKVIFDNSSNHNDGVLGGTMENSEFDPIWTEGESKEDMVDILKDFNGSFEADLEFWRFFEVPNSLGSSTEIIKGDVVHGAKAVKVTYEPATPALGDRALDNWDANMPLEEGAEYFAEFWAKTTTPGTGSLRVTYGFFNENRQVIGEESMWLDITSDYKKYEFSFTAPEGTAKGWLSFRWKDKVEDEFAPGVVILDHIQLWTLDKTVGIDKLIATNTNQAVLKQNYPNPFNTSTTISYTLSVKSDIELSVYNFHGQKVEVLLQQEMSAGSYETIWNPKNLGSGIYFIALRTDTEVLTKKITISKQ